MIYQESPGLLTLLKVVFHFMEPIGIMILENQEAMDALILHQLMHSGLYRWSSPSVPFGEETYRKKWYSRRNFLGKFRKFLLKTS